MSSETKTLNDLAPEYQWNDTLDPDHIFEGEKRLINEVREKLPTAAIETDKFILVFLIARRHDVPETITLLKKFKKLQEDCDVTSECPPSFTYHPLLSGNKNKMPILQLSGSRDVHDRMLRYMFMEQVIPNHNDKEVYTFFIWNMYYMLQEEPISAWRNGMAFVIDLRNFGWKNVDTSSKGRAINKDLQGSFPFRMRIFYVINGTKIMNALIAAAKLVLPKKISSRLINTEVSQLKDLIPPEHLLVRYEGAQTADGDTWFSQILKNEERFYKDGIWKQKNV